MGRKYKLNMEREWTGKTTDDMKMKTLQIQADKNISRLCRGKCRRRLK